MRIPGFGLVWALVLPTALILPGAELGVEAFV